MRQDHLERAAARVAARAAASFRDDVDRLRRDAGVSVAALARAAAIDVSYLYKVLAGTAEPSEDTRARLAVALGADLSVHLYPNTGPAVRDRHQGPILEALLAMRHPRWHPFTELRVLRPSRGWIDVAFHEPVEGVIVATEIQSELHRIEQLVRWSAEKAASLPSWEGWDRLGRPSVSQLLVVRRTRATRTTAADFAQQLRVAYPAHPDDAIAALTTVSAPWPGPALVWVEVTASGARLLPGR
ncbi:MAG: helix-turn-helix domain-containing protein [Candidatus Limnocylindrales bacterium]